MSEIDPFPRAVLAQRFPGVPVHGDFTTIQAGDYEPIDLLVGGTPCQSFSVAGLRGGLADERGNLALEYLRLADRLRPRWLVWENVPGVLSSSGGRDFGAFLGGLGQLGYGFAYRVLDAQFFGVAQRRRRVFVVGYLGDWRRAAAVLFEPASLRGHPAPRREAGERAAICPALRAGGNSTGGDRPPGIDVDTAESLIVSRCVRTGEGRRQDHETTTLVTAPSLRAQASHRLDSEAYVAHTLRGERFDASEDGSGRGTPLVPVAFHPRQDPISGDVAMPCEAKGPMAVAFNHHKSGNAGSSMGVAEDHTDCLRAFEKSPFAAHLAGAPVVRRLTPRECERLQGFPDDWTLVQHRGKPAADGPRYKAIGNSMAVPVLRWIGERIQKQEAQA